MELITKNEQWEREKWREMFKINIAMEFDSAWRYVSD